MSGEASKTSVMKGLSQCLLNSSLPKSLVTEIVEELRHILLMKQRPSDVLTSEILRALGNALPQSPALDHDVMRHVEGSLVTLLQETLDAHSAPQVTPTPDAPTIMYNCLSAAANLAFNASRHKKYPFDGPGLIALALRALECRHDTPSVTQQSVSVRKNASLLIGACAGADARGTISMWEALLSPPPHMGLSLTLAQGLLDPSPLVRGAVCEALAKVLVTLRDTLWHCGGGGGQMCRIFQTHGHLLQFVHSLLLSESDPAVLPGLCWCARQLFEASSAQTLGLTPTDFYPSLLAQIGPVSDPTARLKTSAILSALAGAAGAFQRLKGCNPAYAAVMGQRVVPALTQGVAMAVDILGAEAQTPRARPDPASPNTPSLLCLQYIQAIGSAQPSLLVGPADRLLRQFGVAVQTDPFSKECARWALVLSTIAQAPEADTPGPRGVRSATHQDPLAHPELAMPPPPSRRSRPPSPTETAPAMSPVLAVVIPSLSLLLSVTPTLPSPFAHAIAAILTSLSPETVSAHIDGTTTLPMLLTVCIGAGEGEQVAAVRAALCSALGTLLQYRAIYTDIAALTEATAFLVKCAQKSPPVSTANRQRPNLMRGRPLRGKARASPAKAQAKVQHNRNTVDVRFGALQSLSGLAQLVHSLPKGEGQAILDLLMEETDGEGKTPLDRILHTMEGAVHDSNRVQPPALQGIGCFCASLGPTSALGRRLVACLCNSIDRREQRKASPKAVWTSCRALGMVLSMVKQILEAQPRTPPSPSTVSTGEAALACDVIASLCSVLTDGSHYKTRIQAAYALAETSPYALPLHPSLFGTLLSGVSHALDALEAEKAGGADSFETVTYRNTLQIALARLVRTCLRVTLANPSIEHSPQFGREVAKHGAFLLAFNARDVEVCGKASARKAQAVVSASSFCTSLDISYLEGAEADLNASNDALYLREMQQSAEKAARKHASVVQRQARLVAMIANGNSA
ncbi:hypothetical protein KIPB_001296 [Kipferlia bialata]|uniref:DUF4042 domain-containing protein n=1 Tax=Kipferlia bialata TaxID=797122 RepID=A0A9K3CNM6_9EUKA|nr:hypothetical protein KIPB_001296 [Kipferlia bialata]|eukprot:g1296.t1